MGELSFLQKVKQFIGRVAVAIYLWSQDVEYLDDLFEQTRNAELHVAAEADTCPSCPPKEGSILYGRSWKCSKCGRTGQV